jgi:hypothetical protein
MRQTLVLLILASSLFLVGCKKKEDLTIRDACIYLKSYLVVSKPTDHPETKKASRKQIEHYKRFCK